MPNGSCRRADAIKRLIDLGVAGAALVATAPVVAVAAAAVRLGLGRPVLFRQERAGQGGCPFMLMKLRTMRPPGPSEDGPDHDGARLTPLGRLLRATSVDELPSLWNVVRGDMSLVGPRPLPMRYLDRYTPAQARRLEVVPGLTGWAQVNGRNRLSWDERFELDRWYVDHRSVALDLRILALTVARVLTGRGISQLDHATMPEFTGPREGSSGRS